jgi:hypothetical protein
MPQCGFTITNVLNYVTMECTEMLLIEHAKIAKNHVLLALTPPPNVTLVTTITDIIYMLKIVTNHVLMDNTEMISLKLAKLATISA